MAPDCDSFSNRSQQIHNQYEQWPYPKIPLVGSVRRTDTWQINLSYIKDRCGLGPPPSQPQILIVGCGTFQPYVFALANPNAHILATDISQESLKIARYRNLLHGLWRVRYQTLDLNRPDTYPDGPFDYIECYGVLMNLDDPEKTLQSLALRLSDEGIIRIMVYPHYSRGRIFQIQRLAKLLGLHHRDRMHPGRLRKVILALPLGHPLRYAFSTYRDSQNMPGIVDGFLHAGDHGFTGVQLGDLIANTGLQPAFYFHRPWGQPDQIPKALNLPDDWSDAMILHYLDLWQELRTNFVVCLTKKDLPSPTPPPQNITPHPLLQLKQGPLLHRLKMGVHALVGIKLPSRTESDHFITLTGQELRCLTTGSIERFTQLGILIGKNPHARPLHKVGSPGIGVPPPSYTIALGKTAPNPFYGAIFQAYTFQKDCKPSGLVPLDEQIKRWQPMADPLEEEGAFGLTPYGTYLCFSREIRNAVARENETVSCFDQVRFKEEDIQRVVSFLKQFPFPHASWSEAELRELWILLFSYPYLFLESSRPPNGGGRNHRTRCVR